MIIFFSLIALFTALIWLDYYRQIDIFYPEKVGLLLLVFILGGASTQLVTGLDWLWPQGFGFAVDGFSLNTFFYFLADVAFIEELSKLLPLLIVLAFFKKELNEPLDYLVYIGISALGFAAVENTFYFARYGATIIDSRGVLSTLSHVFDSSIVAYGFMLVRFHPTQKQKWRIPAFFALGVVCHALYNFILAAAPYGLHLFLVIIYFFLTISIFSTILNNALNNSPHFSYAKTVNSHKVLNRLLSGYLVVFSAQYLAVFIETDLLTTADFMRVSAFSTGFVLIVSSVRLSRFTLIKERWFPVKLEMPFTLNATAFLSEVTASRRGGISIKGNAYNESAIAQHYQNYFSLSPARKFRTKLKKPHKAFYEEKLFLKNNESCYLVKLYFSNAPNNFQRVLLLPKTNGESFTKQGSPIMALVTVEPEKIENPRALKVSDCRFVEWCLVKPLN